MAMAGPELSKSPQAELQPNTAGSSEGEETTVISGEVFARENDTDHVIHDSDADVKRDWLEVAMVTVNNHLQAFRMLPWVMGGLGALLIVKYSGMVRDIPIT